MSTVTHSRSFKWRGVLGLVVLLPVAAGVAFSTPVVGEGSPLDCLLDSCAWLFLVLYATLRVWATLYLGGRKDTVLQTTGIYSATRNPLYLGSACLAISASLFFDSLVLLFASAAVACLYGITVIRSEERVLHKLFGTAFDEYARRTPRFLPRFSSYSRPDAINVDVSAFGREAMRLWGAATLPILAESIGLLRVSPDWPHWFHLL